MSYNKKFATQPKKQMTAQQRKAKLQQNYFQKFGKPYPSKMSSTNQQALRTGGWANPSRGGELKFTDRGTSATLAIAGATFSTPFALTDIAQGTSASERIGRKLTIKSILVKWTASLAPTSIQGSPIRWMVVYDKQANGVAPAITDILLTDAFTSANNLSNRDRFVTIFDQIVDPVSVQGNYSCAGVNFKALNLEQLYNAGTTGAIGSIASGSVYLMAAQTGSIGTAGPVFSAQVRIRYTDV